MQTLARWVDLADSYTYAQMYNEQERNDHREDVFDAYTLERFRLGDSPIMYPSMDWKEYMTKNLSIQTQHNLNISGGTEGMRYFISVGYLYQDGLLKTFGQDNGYKYNRYNYRANLDFNLTKSTLLKVGIGGVVGDRQEPYSGNQIWGDLSKAQPFAGAGLVDGKPIISEPRYKDIKMLEPFTKIYTGGKTKQLSNTMNIDLHLSQKLDCITKGLSAEVKGAYNSSYSHYKYHKTQMETYTAYFESDLNGSGLKPGDPDFNYNIVHQINGTNSKPSISEGKSRGRNWYFEASLRYKRQFGDHNVSALLLYNQSKKYYPSQFPDVANAYVGLVGRATYDYKSRYMAEFNIGYNGSENFSPDKRFGTFPAVSIGWVLSEENFIKKLGFIDFLKVRASVGLVGNDNMSGNRFLYLPDAYDVDKKYNEGGNWKEEQYGYNFGLNNKGWIKAAIEKRLGNKNVTWETALKQNYGIDLHVLDNRLHITAEYFRENRKDILISRHTIPGLTALTSSLLPVVNMGEVKNHGYELEFKWNDNITDDLRYHINANMSYSKNEIVFQDEVEPNEPYLWRTGKQVGAIFGYVSEGFYAPEDFVNGKDGELVEGLPKPQVPVFPGDVKYKDLNNDHVIDPDDQQQIGYSSRPNYTFGLNYGLNWKGWYFSMNWTGTAERSIALSDQYRKPFNGEARGLMQYQVEGRWTPETAQSAIYPRFSKNSGKHNSLTSTLWVKDGSYLKLKNVTLGYNFKKNDFFKKLGISQLGVKLTGYNLLCFDKLDIIDPEFYASYNTTKYPVTRQYTLGVNITF